MGEIQSYADRSREARANLQAILEGLNTIWERKPVNGELVVDLAATAKLRSEYIERHNLRI